MNELLEYYMINDRDDDYNSDRYFDEVLIEKKRCKMQERTMKIKCIIGVFLTSIWCFGLYYGSYLLFPYLDDKSGVFFVLYFTLMTFFLLMPGIMGLILGVTWIKEDIFDSKDKTTLEV